MDHKDYKDRNLCAYLGEYVIQQLNDVDRLRYERHLASCVACQTDLQELQEAWNELPYTANIVEPPPDLKRRVFAAIFPAQQLRNFSAETGRPRKSLWFYAVSALVILAVLIGTIWNYQITKERRILAQLPPDQPSQVRQLFPLAAEGNSSGRYDSYGVACIVKQGNQSMLVVYLFGAAANRGKEAYQVWLLTDNERANAGTFRVGDEGIGVLTYPISHNQLTFDSIGITLEPDSRGNRPRGHKVFGNTKEIVWN